MGFASKQLRDVRDGKYYWVTKLADGKCWMTQNLDLDLTYDLAGADRETGVLLTSETSDVGEDWIPSGKSTIDPTKNLFESTAVVADWDTILTDDRGMRSWSLGATTVPTNNDVYIANNVADYTSCGVGLATAIDCSRFIASSELYSNGDPSQNAHYALGNYYQWNTATAGTGGTITEGQATGSICPSGWGCRLLGRSRR